MAFDFDRMAPTYDAHRQGRGPYYETLLGLLHTQQAKSVLELGAGTGNNTLAVQEDTNAQLYALEPSWGMLQTGRQKSPAIRWLQGDATALPYTASTFHALFGTYMLHHIPYLIPLMEEAHRVLHPNGLTAFVTVSESFIQNHPMNAWFPSFAKVDLARFQPIQDVCATMEAAGFEDVSYKHTYSPPRAIDTDYVQRVADKFITTYALLPEDEFQDGVTRLRKAVADGPLDTPIVREATVVWGYKYA